MTTSASISIARQERKCSIEGCGRKHMAKGLCKRHYSQARAHGAPDPTRPAPHEGERLLREYLVFDGDECLLWPYAIDDDGYGSVYIDGRRMAASRAMCILAHGPPPFRGAHAAHSCGNPPCFNRKHVSWATPQSNIEDKIRHGTLCRGQKHHKTILTNEQVLGACSDPRSDAELAQELECSAATIAAIRSGRNWSWLTGRWHSSKARLREVYENRQ